MDAVAGMTGGEDKQREEEEEEEGGFAGNCSPDPLLYQLVRVEGDGTLIPATEDEVLQFEHLLDDEKNDLPLIEDDGCVEGLLTDDALLTKETDFGGFSQTERTNVLPEKLDDSIEENRIDVPFDDFMNISGNDIPLNDSSVERHFPELLANAELQENVSDSGLLHDNRNAEKENTDACSEPAIDMVTSDASVSETLGSSLPDFCLSKGEIYLDNLTIRELQETFRVTFGRETTVKDKSWLKRRIKMALTNSFDIPTSSHSVKSEKFAPNDNMEATENLVPVSKSDSNYLPGEVTDLGVGSDFPSSEGEQRFDKRFRGTLEVETPKECPQDEHHSVKRLRKPTRRYIEELSDADFRELSRFSSAKKALYDQVLVRSRATSYHEVGPWNRTVPTRQETLGGSNVQVPYGSRMRRSRPRTEYISFLTSQPSAMEYTSDNRTGQTTGHEIGETRSHLKKARSTFGRISPMKCVDGMCASLDMPTTLKSDPEYNSAHEEVHFGEEASFEIPRASSAAKGGMKRKHHRAWSLKEVMKLVEGVARFGAGRWSEIRRLAFASYSYRTSVDLKDKWRNLIRASLAQLPVDKDGGSARKLPSSSMPIPVPILLRVRELAKLHSQAGSELGARGKNAGKPVQSKGPGFL